MVVIPLQALPSYSFSVTLDAIALLFAIRWNVRGAFYTLDISTRDEALLIAGIKLVVNSGGLIRKFPKAGMPPGELQIVDASGDNTPIAFADLGERVEFVYATEAEIAAL